MIGASTNLRLLFASRSASDFAIDGSIVEWSMKSVLGFADFANSRVTDSTSWLVPTQVQMMSQLGASSERLSQTVAPSSASGAALLGVRFHTNTWCPALTK